MKDVRFIMSKKDTNEKDYNAFKALDNKILMME
jgi:hypothetical protein